MVDKDSQTSNWYYDEFHPEGIVIMVVRCLELKVDEVDGCQGSCYEY